MTGWLAGVGAGVVVVAVGAVVYAVRHRRGEPRRREFDAEISFRLHRKGGPTDDTDRH